MGRRAIIDSNILCAYTGGAGDEYGDGTGDEDEGGPGTYQTI